MIVFIEDRHWEFSLVVYLDCEHLCRYAYQSLGIRLQADDNPTMTFSIV